MQLLRRFKRLIFNPVWLVGLLVAIIVACGGEDPTATSAPAAEPTAAPAATSAPGEPTAMPAATEEAAPAPDATTRAPGARPQVQGTPTAIPTAAPTVAQVPSTSEAKVTRVSMANPLPLTESNRIWSAAWSILIQHDPYGETLIENDPRQCGADSRSGSFMGSDSRLQDLEIPPPGGYPLAL